MLSSVSALYHVPLPKNVVVRSARECSRPTAIASKLCSDSTGNKQVETSIGVRSNFSRGGATSTLCLQFSSCWRCSVNGPSQNALSLLHHKENDPRYGNIHKKYASLAAIPKTQVYCHSLQYTEGQRLQTFLFVGHISYYSKVRGPEIIVIRNVSVSGWATLYQINMFFVKYIIFHYWQNVFADWVKWLCRPDLARGL